MQVVLAVGRPAPRAHPQPPGQGPNTVSHGPGVPVAMFYHSRGAHGIASLAKIVPFSTLLLRTKEQATYTTVQRGAIGQYVTHKTYFKRQPFSTAAPPAEVGPLPSSKGRENDVTELLNGPHAVFGL